ncbi:MAG: ComEC/Rec2 family competence protein [Bacteroidia bacterium]|nr:ComEC/Rec2 family competence protein [Bacteroidia bacterium]
MKLKVSWRVNPFYRFVAPLIVGIVFRMQSRFCNPDVILYLFFLLISALVITRFRMTSFRYRWVFGFFLQLTIVFIGVISVDIKQKEPSGLLTDKTKKSYTATLLEDPCEKLTTYRASAKLNSLKYGGTAIAADDVVLLYIKKDSLASTLVTGDVISISGVLSWIPPPPNPGEFDFRKTMNNRQIYLQAILGSGTWHVTGHQGGNIILLLSSRMRRHLLGIFRSYGLQGKEFAVLSALTLGYRDELDSETRQAFSDSGTIHILTVSGLHVGIVFFIIDTMLLFMRKNRYLNILRLLIIISVIWFYAFLSGMAPSILRATVMFSFVVAGRSMKRDSNSTNILAATAFFLLLADPFMINETGFQLSFLAVAGILHLYFPIYKLLECRYKLGNRILSLIAVSLAAQISNAPLSIFYFHQFPNYFLLANMVAVPISTIIMYLSAAIFLLSFITPLGLLLGMSLKYSVIALNFTVGFVEGLPYSVTGGLNIRLPEMLLIYLFIITLIIFFFRPKLKYLIVSLSGLSVFLIFHDVNLVKCMNRKKLVVFDIGKSSVINIISGGKNYLITDSLFARNKDQQNFHLKNFRIENHAEPPEIIPVSNLCSLEKKDNQQFITGNMIRFADKQILICESGLLKSLSRSGIRPDFIILTNSKNPSFHSIPTANLAKMLIFDSSNSGWNLKYWEKECRRVNQPYYSVTKSGVYLTDL